MPAGIGAAGIVGIAREATPGTYVAPEYFIPIRSESLAFDQETIFTRPIRGVADPVWAVAGNVAVGGDIEFEVLPDALVYLLYGSRTSLVKSGVGPYVYTFTPTHVGQKSGANSTLSITVVRNGIVFGYTQCVIGQLELTVDSGLFVSTATVLGKDEAVQSAPTPTWPTDAPIGAGSYDIQIPTAAQVFDVDSMTFSVNDNPEHAYRLRDNGRGAQFTKFGEREVTLSVERDFDSRTDYDAYKALTAQEITVRASQDANNYVQFVVNAAIKDSYEVGLEGQGDLVRASIDYMAIYDNGDSQAYEIVVSSDTNIT
jgi:hypothetical protein